MADPARPVQFHSDAAGEDAFLVRSLKGEEELSLPYRYEIGLVSQKADLSLDKLLQEPAQINLKISVPLSGGKRGTRNHSIRGVLSDVQVEGKQKDWISYRAVLVPRLWKCSLITQSRVFQDLAIGDLIKAVLTEKGGIGLTPKDFEVKLTGSYQKREFIVQYNESDLDFLDRWLAHEGVFYYFEQTEDGDKVVFTDDVASYGTLPGDPTLPYRPDSEGRAVTAGQAEEESVEAETISSFIARQRKLPKEVHLRDYNYRTPSVEMKAKADVESKPAEGRTYLYGEHFKTAEEGAAIAKVRAQEIAVQHKVFEGVGDCRSFRCGATFKLDEHFRKDLNAKYVLTRVVHTYTQAKAGSQGTGSATSYKNEFICIPAEVLYRPERDTEWPAIYGLLNAKIDAAGNGQYAELDDQGRYKVVLPFDASGKKDAKASRWVRMVQPYAGPGMGMHFPLHKGTEVVLAFIDGDPDRPIIVGSVPNPETAGPVSGKNQSQCAIHTGGGNKLVVEDTAGKEQILMISPHSATWQTFGAP